MEPEVKQTHDVQAADRFVPCETCAAKRSGYATALCAECLRRRAAIQAAGRAQAEAKARDAVVAAAQELASKGLLCCRRKPACTERLRALGYVIQCARCELAAPLRHFPQAPCFLLDRD